LQDLQEKYAADVETVNIGEWVDELRNRNEIFEVLVKKRFDETSSKTNIVLRVARDESDTGYFAIRDRINALVLVEGGAAYEAFIRALNTVIAKYAVKHHHHHNSQPGVANV